MVYSNRFSVPVGDSDDTHYVGLTDVATAEAHGDHAAVDHIDVDDIQFGKKIGEGSFGVVFHGEWCGTRVAIKQINLCRDSGGSARAEFEQELLLTAKLRVRLCLLFFIFCYANAICWSRITPT